MVVKVFCLDPIALRIIFSYNLLLPKSILVTGYHVFFLF